MIRIKIKLLLLLMMPVIFISCSKETDDKIDDREKYNVDNPDVNASVKFIHAYTPLTINGLATSTVGFRLFMDGTKINGAGTGTTAATSNALFYGGVFPPTTAYSFLPPGLRNFKYTMNRLTGGAFAPITGDEVFNTNLTIAAGKKYSIFIADPYPAPGAYIVEDNFTVPNLGSFGIRFINLCGDAASRFDVFSPRLGQVIFSNVGYKEMKDYIYIPTSSTSETFQLRTAGTTTVVSTITAFSGGTQRVYTLYARGKTGVTGRLPNLTFYTNR